MTFSPKPSNDAQLIPSTDLIDQAKALVEADFPQRVATLGQLVRIPGIAWEAFDAQELERSAEAVAALFKDTGVFDNVVQQMIRLES